jgi:pimeloyl-ACP methyl ester carboxylesterase
VVKATPARVALVGGMPSCPRPESHLAYEVRGEGPWVVLIQGVGAPGRAWGPQVDALADRYRCVVFDHRGIGASGPAPARFGLSDLVDDTVALLDHLGVDSAHVVGHSMGGVIAHQLALDHRRRVRSLALLCTFARGCEAARLSPRVLWVGARTRVGTRRMRRNAFLELILPASLRIGADLDALGATYGAWFGRDLADSEPIATAQLLACRAHDAADRLGELAGLPTLVVSAEHDLIALPAYGRELAGRIPRATYRELAGAAHGVPLSEPDRINEVLAAHLEPADG